MMSFKKSALLALSLFSFSSPAFAETKVGDVTITGNVALTTQYSFRGITQSNEKPALQGGIDLGHSCGLYAGVWGSSIDFGGSDDSQIELDVYAGYAGAYKGLDYDIGLIYYGYPGTDTAREYDFWELALGLGYDFGAAAVSAGINYSPNYFNESGDAQYYHAEVDVPLPYDLTLSGHFGHQEIDRAVHFGVDDYNDWSVGLGYAWQGFDFSLSYVDTDLDEPSECADGCAEKVIFAISRSF
ncbi:MAG: porin [Rhodospirillales bacterium]|nr:porin [Rhodospirillales bacterium]